MTKVCKRHADNPVIIYHQCVGCELEWLHKELEQKQQEIEQYKQFEQKYNEFIKSWEKYQQDKEKMIEGLRYLMKELGKLSVKPENGTAIHAYKKMRNILHEIGVTVEW